jgi:hypothetical protein
MVSSGPRASPATKSAKEAWILAVLQALPEGGGFLWGDPAVIEGLVQPLRRVPQADLADRLVEVLRVGSYAQPRGLLLGDSTGLEHLVEAPKETIAVVVHPRNLWRQSVDVKSAVSIPDGTYTSSGAQAVERHD